MVGHGDRGLAHAQARSEEHTSELQSQSNLVCRLLLEKKKKKRRCLAFIHQLIFSELLVVRWYQAMSYTVEFLITHVFIANLYSDTTIAAANSLHDIAL